MLAAVCAVDPLIEYLMFPWRNRSILHKINLLVTSTVAPACFASARIGVTLSTTASKRDFRGAICKCHDSQVVRGSFAKVY